MKSRKIDIDKYIPEYLKSTIDGDKTDFYKLFEKFESLLNYSYNTSYYESEQAFSNPIYQFENVEGIMYDISSNSLTYQEFTAEESLELSNNNYIYSDMFNNLSAVGNPYYNNVINSLYQFISKKAPVGSAMSGLPLCFVGLPFSADPDYVAPMPILSLDFVDGKYVINKNSMPSINYYTNSLYLNNKTKYYNETVYTLIDTTFAGRSPLGDTELGVAGYWISEDIGIFLNSHRKIRDRILDLSNKMLKAYIGYTSQDIAQYEATKLQLTDDPTGTLWNQLVLNPDQKIFNCILGSIRIVLTELILTYSFMHIQDKNIRFAMVSAAKDISDASNLIKTFLECTNSPIIVNGILGSFGIPITEYSTLFEDLVIDKNGKLLIGSDTTQVIQSPSLWVPSNYFALYVTTVRESITNTRQCMLKNREILGVDIKENNVGHGPIWGDIDMWALHRIKFDVTDTTPSMHMSVSALNSDITYVKPPYMTNSPEYQAVLDFFNLSTSYYSASTELMDEAFADVDNTPLNDFIESEMIKAFGTDDSANLPAPWAHKTVGFIKKKVRRLYRTVILPIRNFYITYLNHVNDAKQLLANSLQYLGYTNFYDIELDETVNENKLSVLEKMDEIQFIGDAEKTNITSLRDIVSSFGFNIDIDINDIALIRYNSDYNSLSTSKQTEVRMIARRFVKSIPSLVKSKTTKSLLNSVFNIFGLSIKVLDYYTKDYSETNFSSWLQTSIDDSVSRSDYYPTSHFGVSLTNKFELNGSDTETLGDTNIATNPVDYTNPSPLLIKYPNNPTYDNFLYRGFDTLVRIVDSIRPINSVFRGIFLQIFVKDLNPIIVETNVVCNEKIHIPWTPNTAPEYAVLNTIGGGLYYLAKPAGILHEHIMQGKNHVPPELIEYSFSDDKEYSYEALSNGSTEIIDEYAISNIDPKGISGKTEIQNITELDSNNTYFIVDQSDCEIVDRVNEYSIVSTSVDTSDRFTISRVYINRKYDCNASGGSNVIVNPDEFVQIETNLQRSTDNTKIIVSGLGFPGLNEVQITERGTGGSHYNSTSGANESIIGSLTTGDPIEPSFDVYNKWFISASWYDNSTKPQMLFNPVFDRQELPTKVELELTIYMMAQKQNPLLSTNKVRYYIVPLKVDWDPQTVSGANRRSGVAWQFADSAAEYRLFNNSEAYYATNDGFAAFELYPEEVTEFQNYNNLVVNGTTTMYSVGSTLFAFPQGYKNQLNTNIFTAKIDVTNAVRRTLNEYGHCRFAIYAAPVGNDFSTFNNIYFATSKLPEWGAELRPKIYVEYPTSTITPVQAAVPLTSLYPTGGEPSVAGDTVTYQSVQFVGRRVLNATAMRMDLPLGNQVSRMTVVLLFTSFPNPYSVLVSSNSDTNVIKVNSGGILDISASPTATVFINGMSVTTGTQLPLNRWLTIEIVYSSQTDVSKFGIGGPSGDFYDLRAYVASIKYYNQYNNLNGHFVFNTGTSSSPNISVENNTPATLTNSDYAVRWYPVSFPDQHSLVTWPDVANYPSGDAPQSVGETTNFTDSNNVTLGYTGQRLVAFNGTKLEINEGNGLSNCRKLKIQFMLFSTTSVMYLFDDGNATNRFRIDPQGILVLGSNIASVTLNGTAYTNMTALTVNKWYDAEIVFNGDRNVTMIGCASPGQDDVKALIRGFGLYDSNNTELLKVLLNDDQQWPHQGNLPYAVQLQYNYNYYTVWVPTSFLSTL